MVSSEVSSKMPARLASVPAFPAVAIKLLSLLADEESNLSSIAACIATDPALSGRLIKRANAADQACYCEARNVLQAVLTLGVDGTREISLAIAMSVYARSAIKTEVLRPFWRHTLACALAAAEIARQCGLKQTEAYTAALMHDIGRLGLLAAYPAEYEEIMTGADGQVDDLAGIERARFGVDNVEAGLWLSWKWNLPESIVEVIVRHHETPTNARDEVAVVQIACRLADLLGFSVNLPGKPRHPDEIFAALPEWTHLRHGAGLLSLQNAIAREIRLLEASEAPPLGTPDVVADAVADAGEPEEEPQACPSSYDVPMQMTFAPYPRRVMVGAVLAGIVLLLSAAALSIQH